MRSSQAATLVQRFCLARGQTEAVKALHQATQTPPVDNLRKFLLTPTNRMPSSSKPHENRFSTSPHVARQVDTREILIVAYDVVLGASLGLRRKFQ